MTATPRRGRFLLVLAASAALVSGCGRHDAGSLLAPARDVAAPYLLGDDLVAALPAPGSEEGAASDVDRAAALTAAACPDRGATDLPSACIRWNELARDLAADAKLPPPAFARVYALVGVAAYDGLVAAEGSGRAPVDAGCAVAGATSEVLADLFPAAQPRLDDAILKEATRAADAGADRGAIVRSFALGRVAGRVAVRRAHADGADRVFIGVPPVGDGLWTGTNPVLPMCGTWRTWIATDGGEFQPEPPYAFGSTADLAEIAAIVAAAAARTPEQVAIVRKWADRSPPAIWNGMLNGEIAARALSPRAAARAQAYLNMAMADGFIACWRTKYAFWIARPVQRIPGFVTVVPTPNFPTYTSGHSTISAAAAEVMGELFPDAAKRFRNEAEEAAISRFWAGIHFTHDDDQGLDVGARLGAKVVSRMRSDDRRLAAD